MEIEIKESWKEVTLREYCKLSEIESKEWKSIILKTANLIEVISNADLKTITSLDSKSFQTLMKKSEFLKINAKQLKSDIVINDIKYVEIPDFNKITTGEMISIEQLYVQNSIDKEPYIFDILPEMLAIVVRPEIEGEIETFDSDKLAERRELFMDNLTVPFLLNVMEILSNGVPGLDKIIKSCLTEREIMMLKETK